MPTERAASSAAPGSLERLQTRRIHRADPVRYDPQETMGYTLYYAPSTASLAVHWMLLELDVPHDLVHVNLEAKEQKQPAYLALNPNGTVPTLVVDGVAIGECAAILMLLAERHPDRGWSPPPGSPSRGEFLQWMFFLANSLQPAFRAWFYADEPAGAANAEAAQAHARTRIEAAWDRIDTHLAARPYFAGEAMTAVDFMGTMLMRWSRNMPKPATAWPSVRRYVEAMRGMPSLREVHAREGLTDWIR